MTEENLQKANTLNSRLKRLRDDVSWLKTGFELHCNHLEPSVRDAMKEAGLGVAEVELDAAQEEFNRL
jgi:hypothetical protein